MSETTTPTQAPTASAPQGLTSQEVAARIRDGLTNAYEETTSRSALDILRANVLTIFNAILGAALVLILLIGHWADALFGFVLILNTSTGTIAEIRAKRALDRLAVLEAPRAHALRDGAEGEIDVADVVLDDVLRLRSGEQIPADGTILDTDGLEVDESILTGESDPVRPKEGGRVLSGTTVTAGTALMRTTAVGAEAYAHRLAREARQFSTVRSELQDGTNRVLTWISWVIVPVALVLIWSQMRQAGGISTAIDSGAWRTAMVAGIAGVVGMVPQGLVLLTSVNFATASLKLARQKVLVQELPAVEVLARVDTLCLDKTGTITTGRIVLREVTAPDGASPDADALAALDALAAGGDANATALALQEGLPTIEPARPGAPAVEARVPFSSRRKWSAVTVGGTTWVMGAPEIVLGACHEHAPERDRALGQVREEASTGARVVALARSEQPCGGGGAEGTDHPLPAGLRPAALVMLAEQVRPDAPETLSYFRAQGVDVKVISGDNPVTVAAVARAAGITRPDGAELTVRDARELPTTADDPADLERLADAVADAQVLGRVVPEQKKALVAALQSRGRTVAMTGDGVNDALALKHADLGIAMGNGAPATKAVARLVLLTGMFSALPGVVAEGRRVMANTERIASLFLSKTVYASLIAVVVAITAIPYPFLPRQLTIVSSLTIGVPALILALAPSARRYREGFLGRVLTLAVPAGLVAGVGTLAARAWLWGAGLADEQITTGATLVLVAAGLALLTLTARPLLGWRLGLVILMGVLAVLGVVVPPVRRFFLLAWPTSTTWLIVAAMAAIVIAGMEAVHLARPRLARTRLGQARAED